MSNVTDTKIVGYKGKQSDQQGRWIETIRADGRKSNLHLYMRDDKSPADDDATYLGYFDDLSKPVVCCNFAIVLEGDTVNIQTLKPGGSNADVKHKRMPVAQFMDLLDAYIADGPDGPQPTKQPAKPTVGRIVNYVLSKGDIPEEARHDKAGRIIPAIIVNVWSDTCVNLRLIPDGTNDGFRPDTMPWVTSRNLDAGKGTGTWHWPVRA